MEADKKEQDTQDDIEITEEEATDDVDLEEVEENIHAKIKKLREKLKQCEQEKMEHLENLQRAKAEFLNAKKRMEEERKQDTQRIISAHIEKLLPLCDSFHMAMQDTQAWKAIDATWRKGIEGIHSQLHSILDAYGVAELNPQGEVFDPNTHEAVSNVKVTDKKQHHVVQQVLQTGFVRTVDNTQELLRPARVTVGVFEEKKPEKES